MAEPHTPAPTRPRAWRRWVLAGLAGATLLAGTAAWLVRSESGAAALLARVPGLRAEGVQGSLLGGDLSIKRLQLDISGSLLTLDKVQVVGLETAFRFGLAPGAPRWGLQVKSLSAESARWQSGPSTGTASAPTDLHLPLALDLAALHLARLQIDDLPPLRGLHGQLALGDAGGTRHRLQSLRWASDRAHGEIHGEIGTGGALPVQLDATVNSLDGAATAWQAQLALKGPLARPQATARLSGPGANAPALDAEATLAPFAAWPLAALDLRTRELDLAALHASAPRTRLRGTVKILTHGLAAEAQADAVIDNDAPGRWDAGQLPIRHLQLSARGQPQSLGRLTLQALVVELGGEAAGGRLSGGGDWLPEGGSQALNLTLRLDALRPAALDRRLPAMSLSGPLTVQLRGLPALDATATATTPVATVTGTLDGRLDAPRAGAATPAVQLVVDADLSRQALVLRQARATAGDASATLAGELGFGPGAGGLPLQWKAQGRLQAFDPLLWFPGAAPAGPRGPTRLNAQLDGGGRITEPVSLRGWAGQVAVQLQPSQWTGVPLQGELNASRVEGRAATVAARAEAAGNRLALDLQDASDGLAGQATATLDAPALAALAPLWASLPEPLRTWLPRGGTAQGRATGKWPADTPAATEWQAELKASGLQNPRWRADTVTAQAQGRGWGDDALSATVDGARLESDGAKLDTLHAELRGSLREHQFSLQAASPLRPPAWAESLLGAHAGSGSRVQLAASGRWLPEPTGAGRWEGRVARLQGQAGDGSGQPWLAAQDLLLRLAWDPQGRVTLAQADPGRVALPGTALRWSEASYRTTPASSTPRLALKAQIEPFELAPLLARAQPELGWRGDLVLGGEIDIRADERFDADIVFERQKGDLSVADDVRNSATPHRPLGLSDLRLGLAAHGGTWHFTAGLAGRQLGEMAGVATVHTSPAASWPAADAPMDGTFQLHVAQLAAWGGWVPPGWRLGGDLQSAASIGGRWGAPEFSGKLVGRGLEIRNALQGVQFKDGDVEISLKGDKAQIERFEWHGGEGGLLQVTGGATLGKAPEAQLQLKAERLRVLGRIDRRLVTTGQVSLLLRPRSAVLSGQMQVDEGLFDFSRGDAPTLDDDVVFAGAPAASAPAAEPGTPEGEAAVQRPFSTQLDVTLGLGSALRVKGRGLETLLRGDLRITNPGNRLAVRGDVNTERGTYRAYGQKLEIERGRLSFTGPVDDPRLDILAVRPNLDVVVGVAVTGTALNPRVRLTSEPEMSDTDKLSWLVMGRASEGLGRADSALLQRAAVALLAGEGEAPTDAFLANIGLSDFGVRQTGEGAEQTTTVSLGKQLSRRWYLGYERSVNATVGTWQLIYRIAQRFTLRAQSGEDSALDLIWTWRWD
ncbi:MAG: translocation/assembly module TamB domain-containing protein [Vitreoscilla sp.]|nr:translocation/assembly module TamB domain-containing protein [Vitreoscilla sp.]